MRKLPAAAQEERRRQVVGLRESGLTYDAIAAQVGLTRTGVLTSAVASPSRAWRGWQAGREVRHPAQDDVSRPSRKRRSAR